jgi:hypothetical protein
MGEGSERFREPAARGRAAVIVAVAAVVLVLLATSVPGAAVARIAPGVLLVAAIGWAAFWLPVLDVDADRLVVRNPLRTIEVPWGALSGVLVDWQLTLVASSRRVRVWALPHQRPRRSYMRGGDVSPGTTTTELARDRIDEELTMRRGDAAPPAPAADAVGIRVRWNAAPVAVLAVLAALTAVAALL